MQIRFMFPRFVLLFSLLPAFTGLQAQNVGIGTNTPTDKLHVENGSLRIGRNIWQATANTNFVKFGDGDFVTVGEDEADDRMVLRANTFLFKGSPEASSGNVGIRYYNGTPNASLSVGRGTGADGTAAFFGTNHVSHFNYGITEDTYIRGGKDGANIILNDIPAGTNGANVGIGAFPQHAKLEVNGYVGNFFGGTAGIFGNNILSGVSMNMGLVSVGLNHYWDGAHRTLQQGYAAFIGFDLNSGDLYLANFGGLQSISDYGSIGNFTKQLTIKQTGDVNINGELNRQTTTGSANLLPVAYGRVNGNGAIISGTGNFTVSKAGTGAYDIGLNNDPNLYSNRDQYMVLVTPYWELGVSGESANLSQMSEISSANKIRVSFSLFKISWLNHGDCGCSQTELNTYINSAAYIAADATFSFVVYRL